MRLEARRTGTVQRMSFVAEWGREEIEAWDNGEVTGPFDTWRLGCGITR